MQSGGYLAVFGSFSGPRDPASAASSVLTTDMAIAMPKRKLDFY
jgi:hypothetical protein